MSNALGQINQAVIMSCHSHVQMQNSFSKTDGIWSNNTEGWFEKKDMAPTLTRRQDIQSEIKQLK